MSTKKHDKIKKAGSYIFSAACGSAASVVLLPLFSAGMYMLGLPPETAGAMSLVAYAGGCFVCGIICGSIKGRRGLRTGVICAGVMTVLMLAASFISGNLTGSAAVVKTLSAAAACCLGSVIGVNRKYK